MKLLFTTNSNPDLTKLLIRKAGLRLGKYQLGRFVDKEIKLELKEEVRGKEVCVLGSSFSPPENLLELLILINTLKINGVKKITAIIPYFGYSRSDHQYLPGTPINARLMAQLIETAGATKIITLSLHGKTKKFFRIPITHLSAMPLLADYVKKLKIKNLVVACPDKGGIPLAKEFARALKIKNILTLEKSHPTPQQTKVIKISGDPRDKNIVLVDDMIQSGGTIIKAAEALRASGAKIIYVAVAHLVSTGPALNKLKTARTIKQVIITNSVPIKNLPKKLKIVDISGLIARHLYK
ncbi:MAG: ribose-phosphate pyrophosphokinase [Candidatus Harrisonbacteria bacterium]|nr:ribose-phosphate pyrophosphokinase [Candidatus Harrisonbacteria bacterium]